MGYNTNLCLVQVTNMRDTPLGYPHSHMCRYFILDMRLDLGALRNSALANLHNRLKIKIEARNTRYWTYRDNKVFIEDAYRDPICVTHVRIVLDALEKDCEHDDYRRIHWARDFLRSVMARDHKGFRVALYGS